MFLQHRTTYVPLPKPAEFTVSGDRTSTYHAGLASDDHNTHAHSAIPISTKVISALFCLSFIGNVALYNQMRAGTRNTKFPGRKLVRAFLFSTRMQMLTAC